MDDLIKVALGLVNQDHLIPVAMMAVGFVATTATGLAVALRGGAKLLEATADALADRFPPTWDDAPARAMRTCADWLDVIAKFIKPVSIRGRGRG